MLTILIGGRHASRGFPNRIAAAAVHINGVGLGFRLSDLAESEIVVQVVFISTASTSILVASQFHSAALRIRCMLLLLRQV